MLKNSRPFAKHVTERDVENYEGGCNQRCFFKKTNAFRFPFRFSTPARCLSAALDFNITFCQI